MFPKLLPSNQRTVDGTIASCTNVLPEKPQRTKLNLEKWLKMQTQKAVGIIEKVGVINIVI